jgi:4-hydroxybenzoate polyprenyltransferase
VYSWIRRLAGSFERSPVPLPYFFLTFFFWVSLRNVLEGYVYHEEITAPKNAHFSLSYLALVLTLSLVVAPFARKAPVQVLRLMLPAFVLVLLAPTLDAVAFRHLGVQITYLQDLEPAELFIRYLTYFGPLEKFGITPGMRIEMGVVLLLCFFYIHAVAGSWMRALAGAFCCYTLLFCYCSIAALLGYVAGAAGLELALGNHLYFKAYTLIIALDALLIGAWSAPRTFRPIARDSRFLRALHFLLLFLLGLGFAEPPQRLELQHVLSVSIGLLGVWLVWIYAVMVNNLHDVEIDRINDPGRPLVTGAVDPERYRRISWWVLGAALAAAWAASYSTLWFVSIFGLTYFVYSAPPLRLKVRCAVSKTVIGINSAAAFLAGFVLWEGKMLDVPLWPLLVILVGFSLGAHVIDLKDVEGDRQAGIKNLATLLGKQRAQGLLATAIMLAHLAGFWMLRSTWLGWVFAVGGLAQFFIISGKRYRDSYMMAVQDMLLGCAVVFVWGL